MKTVNEAQYPRTVLETKVKSSIQRKEPRTRIKLERSYLRLYTNVIRIKAGVNKIALRYKQIQHQV